MTDPTATPLPSWRLPNGGRVDAAPQIEDGYPVPAMTWEEHQDWENAWWGSCVNTFGEEAKSLSYMDRLGWVNTPQDGQWPVYDLGGRSVLDVGGGPTSVLLKCVNGGALTVADPCRYPQWTVDRYTAAEVNVVRVKGERLLDSFGPHTKFDEVIGTNVLQHTDDPERVAANARSLGKLIRWFDWIDTPPEPGHPHTLTVSELDRWFGVTGRVETFTGENGLSGPAWIGVSQP